MANPSPEVNYRDFNNLMDDLGEGSSTGQINTTINVMIVMININLMMNIYHITLLILISAILFIKHLITY
jgi:hypothetical protein